MAFLPAEKTSFEKLVFPKSVYKYRESENEKHRTILKDRVVYLAPPKSFEDDLDCKIPIRHDLLSDDEIFENYLKTLKEINPTWDSGILRNEAILWSKKGLLRDKNRLKQMDIEFYEDLNERYGVLSLAGDALNVEMWTKYSKNFNGFCVGFDPKIMFKELGGGGKVSYWDSLPIIMPADSIDFKLATLTFSKLKKWEFEDEYRIFQFWPQIVDEKSRKKIIPGSAFTELIIGHNTNDEDRKEIIKQAKSLNPFIEIKLTSLIDNEILTQTI